MAKASKRESTKAVKTTGTGRGKAAAGRKTSAGKSSRKAAKKSAASRTKKRTRKTAKKGALSRLISSLPLVS